MENELVSNRELESLLLRPLNEALFQHGWFNVSSNIWNKPLVNEFSEWFSLCCGMQKQRGSVSILVVTGIVFPMHERLLRVLNPIKGRATTILPPLIFLDPLQFSDSEDIVYDKISNDALDEIPLVVDWLVGIARGFDVWANGTISDSSSILSLFDRCPPPFGRAERRALLEYLIDSDIVSFIDKMQQARSMETNAQMVEKYSTIVENAAKHLGTQLKPSK